MNTPVCSSCLKDKNLLECGACKAANPEAMNSSGMICKKCAHFVDPEDFSFLTKIPVALTYAVYCEPCYQKSVLPEQESYNEAMQKAGEVMVYNKTEGKETRTFSRKEKPLIVENCSDKEETLMKLAFLAAKANYNTLIDVDYLVKKIITNGYQRSSWRGIGIPCNTSPRNR